MQSPTPLQFPQILDNTIRSAFVACPKKAYWLYFRNITSKEESPHLNAGGAFAKGIEVFRRTYWSPEHGRDFQSAYLAGFYALTQSYGYHPELEAGEWAETTKSYENTVAAYASYWERYAPDTDVIQPHVVDGKPLVEFSFVLPLEENHPVTGEPLLYSGRFDMVGEYQSALFGVDEKTTSQLGPTWSKRWDLHAQFTGYCWGAREYGYDLAGMIVRGVSIQKRETKHGMAIVYRPRWEVDRWYEQLHRDIRRMKAAFADGWFDYNLSDSCTAYGGCPFLLLCKSQNPEPWLESNYRTRIWDPTNPTGEPQT